MLFLGCHLSLSKGYEAMGRRALELGANTFQYFTRNPRGGKRRDFDEEDAEKLGALCLDHDFGPLIAHAPYTLNPASPKDHVVDFALRAIREDLERLERLPLSYYNFHPGSHVGRGRDRGILQIIDVLNRAIPETCTVPVLLETMAGKGTEIGRTFEDLAQIIDGVHRKDLIGVCLDTCHISDGGYDLLENPQEVLEEFDRIVGLSRLKALHLNDSKNPRGAGKDRHAKLGEGTLGLSPFSFIVNHPLLKTLPMCLETPQEKEEGYAEEIALLRSLEKEDPPRGRE